jgi:hypothetical protein
VSFGAKRAAVVNIAPTRAFVELRRAAASYAAIERRLEDLGPGDNALAEALLDGLPRPA